MIFSAVNSVTLYVASFLLLAGIVTGVVFWWKRRKAAKASSAGAASSPDAPAGGAQMLPALFREANSRLRLSPRMKGASLSSLPVIFVLGPGKSGKTSVVMRSGLDPELLAGQVYQGTAIIPTESLNIWLARQSLIVEISAALAGDPQALRTIVKQFAPGRLSAAFRRVRPARGILLCVNQAPLAAAATLEEIGAAARPWNQCITELANSLGAQLPVYVLFTALDGLAGFAEFVSHLTDREPEQALGATIRPFNPAGRGAYAEETARIVDSHFSQIVYSLCDSRVPLLIRETERVAAALQYQFPRDFQRPQKNLVQFLVEVAKPSQLRVSAFLRGFYFSGIRKVMVDLPSAGAQPASREMSSSEALMATTVLTPEQLRDPMAAAAQVRPSTGRENTEWLFVRSLFDGVIFRDRAAQGVSSTTSRGERARVLIFGFVALLGLAMLVGLTISYVRNRNLENEIRRGAVAMQALNSGSDLQRLEKLRPAVESLLDVEASPPVFMRLGLFTGNELMPAAQELYCPPMLDALKPVLQLMAGHLQALGHGSDPEAEFATLKAYMMVTTRWDKADPIMAETLLGVWRGTTHPPAGDVEADQQLRQFRTYLRLLPYREGSSCRNSEGPGLIEKAQDYFKKHYNDSYQNLLQQADRTADAVDYNKLFNNPAVSDAKIVRGCFTRAGWDRMQRILEHPGEYLQSNSWVLGESREVTAAEISDYRTRYANDYKAAWKEYLKSAQIVPYRNPEDAAAKLDPMSDQNASVLLSLLGLASENTSVNDDVKAAFQPVHAVATDRASFAPAKDYLAKLMMLKNRMGGIPPTGPARENAIGQVRLAVTGVNDSIGVIQGLPDFKGETKEEVKRILQDPVRSIEHLIQKQDSDTVNSAAEDLCRGYNSLIPLFPFTPASGKAASAEEVDRFFQRPTGQMWRFSTKFLTDSLDCANNGCVVRADPRFAFQQSFVDFFSRLIKISNLLYGGELRVVPQSHNDLKQLTFIVNGTRIPVPVGTSAPIPWDFHNSGSFRVTGDFEGVPADEPVFDPRRPANWALYEWLYRDSAPQSGRPGVFRFLDPVSRLRNGKPREYEIQIQYGSPSSLLDLPNLRAGTCPQQPLR